jgi:AAA domain
MSLHTAHALQWLGRKTKAGEVVYIAAEGGLGLLSRIEAWHQRHGLDPSKARFRVCVRPLMLDKGGDIKALSDAIAEGEPPALIVIDTMAQTMTGDENEAQAMSTYLRAIGTYLRARYGAAVLIVHHTGHNAGDRARGSSAIGGNTDFVFRIDRPGDQMAAGMHCLKQKDGDKGEVIPFVLERRTVGEDEDGEPVTSLVAFHQDNAKAILDSAAKGASKYAEMLLQCVPTTGGQKVFVRSEFLLKLGDMEPAAKRQAFHRAYSELIKRNDIDEDKGQVWYTRQD